MRSGVGAGLLVMFLINLLLGGLATEYIVEFWAGYAKGVPVDVPFFPCAIAGLFVGTAAIPLAVATWVLSFVL